MRLSHESVNSQTCTNITSPLVELGRETDGPSVVPDLAKLSFRRLWEECSGETYLLDRLYLTWGGGEFVHALKSDLFLN